MLGANDKTRNNNSSNNKQRASSAGSGSGSALRRKIITSTKPQIQQPVKRSKDEIDSFVQRLMQEKNEKNARIEIALAEENKVDKKTGLPYFQPQIPLVPTMYFHANNSNHSNNSNNPHRNIFEELTKNEAHNNLQQRIDNHYKLQEEQKAKQASALPQSAQVC